MRPGFFRLELQRQQVIGLEGFFSREQEYKRIIGRFQEHFFELGQQVFRHQLPGFVRQIIFFTQKGLVSVVPQTGKVLWRQPYKFDVSTASSPIVSDDIVYCSAAYNVGAGAFRIAKDGDNFSAAPLWRQEGKLMNHWTTPVCKDGYLYGLYGHGKAADAPLKCVEIATGKEMWSKPGFGGGGATVLVGGNVLVQSDRGPLVLVEASPKEYREIARAQIYGGQCWTMPVVSGGRIFARNTKEGFCLNVVPQTATR